MVSLLLITGNKREEQILKVALEQAGITVLLGVTGYNNYVKMLQYVPDVVLIEMPRINIDHLHFTELIRTHRRTKSVPIISYGDPVEEVVKRGMLDCGSNLYLARPLRFGEILTHIKRLLKSANKEFEVARPTNDQERDSKLLLDPATPATKKIEVLSAYVTKMLAFPFTVAKVLQITGDESSGANDLARAMEADPVISANILRLSNSVFFAASERRINSVKDAIVRLGFRETRRIVMAMSVMKLFAAGNKNLGFDRIDFWYHSLATAVIASHVARHMGAVSIDEAFVAGLLHDFGMLLLDEFFPAIFSRVLEETANSGAHFVDKESEVLGMNHNDLISELFPKWKIPATITQGIVDQYKFQTGGADAPGAKIALCVGIANIMAKTLYLGRECDQYILPIDNKSFETAKMLGGFTAQTIDAIYHDITVFRQFLGLEVREFVGSASPSGDPRKGQIGIVNAVNDIFVPPVHYLPKVGFTIERMIAEKPTTEYDNRFDLLIVWARGNDPAGSLEKYSRVVRGAKGPVDGRSLAYAPLLVMSDEARTGPAGDGTAPVTFMRNRFDLRELDKRIFDSVSALPGSPAVAAG